MSFAAFRAYIDAYELSGVEAGARPPERTAQLLSGASTVFDTLARLGVEATVADAEFREAPPLAPHLPLRLPVVAWLALARVRGEFDPALAPARDDLRRRAGNCAGKLIEASAQGDVALVGHGWFNRYVARALAGRGRRKTSGSGFHRPWGYLIFR